MKKMVLVILAAVMMMGVFTGCSNPVGSPIKHTTSSQMQKFENPQTGDIEWVELED